MPYGYNNDYNNIFVYDGPLKRFDLQKNINVSSQNFNFCPKCIYKKILENVVWLPSLGDNSTNGICIS